LRKLAVVALTGLTTGEKLIRKRMAEAPLLITLPLGKQIREPIGGVSTPPILRTDGENKLPLLEQNAVGFAQRLTDIIRTRSLGSSSIQLENFKTPARPELFDRGETNIISANEKSRKIPRDRIDSRLELAAPKVHSVAKDTTLRMIPCLDEAQRATFFEDAIS
jgi:hypothetical protein